KKIVSTKTVTPKESGPLILVIEDDNDEREIIKRALQKLGYRIEVAGSGQEGIDLAINILPDCVILDVMMPQMDGIETANKLRSIPTTENIPIIAPTAHDEFVVEKKMIKAGADAFCSKLITKDELSRQIDHLLLKIS